ncbi:MAG: response regulator transcription factor [Deltaproteobacteria bacterium]|nr:response regulator transcription factor [Deltaproteobacteria bacterium]
MIRAILVDDEPLGRRRMLRLLQDHPDVEVIAEAGDGRSARAEVLTRRPDLLFLDVQMPGEDGPTALRALRETLPEDALPLVIFTTAHSEHALEAFALEALDYLLKPVEKAGLARALKRVRKRRAEAGTAAPAPPDAPVSDGPRRILAQRGNRTIPLEIDNIGAVVVEDDTVHAWTLGGRFRLDGTLREVTHKLPPDFVQVSRSAVLRPDWILELRPLASGTFEAALRDIEGTVHISRRRGRELRRLLDG